MNKAEAEKTIAGILAQLERDTGQLVSDVDVISVDITSLDDKGPVHAQKVVIEMVRLPGHQWVSDDHPS